jgi:CDP-6-deoxy-D-xylo-4-hexulose-3-dehydrase
MKKINHSLMENNIEDSDVDSLRKFLNMNKKKIFTQSSQVKLFEKNWSKWLDCKYSIFVNSGSSANLLSILCLKIDMDI